MAFMEPSVSGLKSLISTATRFELITKLEKPTFQNDLEYVDYAMSVLQRRFAFFSEIFTNDLEETSSGLTKSSLKSEDLRNIGNAFFRDRHFFEAHNFYTMSIAYAKSGSKELALAYGNRSAVLFEKQYYKECLEDIQRALENHFPQEKRAKLLMRQAKAKELLPTQKKVLCHGTIPLIKRRNPNMPSASECIKINKNEEFGRHIVANRTINPGEILLVEKPFSKFVFPDSRTNYCSECMEVCYNMIPCEKCSGVLYCTKACKRKAYVDYHQYECVILTHFGYDIINWNATRLTLKGLKEYDTEHADPDVYCSDRYKEYSELACHKSDKDQNMLWVSVAGVAKVFYVLKKYTDIFTVFDIDNKENVLKTLLFNNTYIERGNGVLVDEIYNNDLKLTFGKAIYSNFSMFNHACNENVGHSFYGSLVVLRAMKRIKKGEQCFINYGVRPVTDKRRRQEFLQNSYHFTCKCQACIQNWPATEMFFVTEIRCKSYFNNIYLELALDGDISQHRKRELLQKTFKITEKMEPEAPFLSYVYSRGIFDKLLLEGNALIPF